MKRGTDNKSAYQWVHLTLNPCDIVISDVYQVIQLMNVEFVILYDVSCFLVHLRQQEMDVYNSSSK